MNAVVGFHYIINVFKILFKKLYIRLPAAFKRAQYIFYSTIGVIKVFSYISFLDEATATSSMASVMLPALPGKAKSLRLLLP